ncbi:TetR/AcrR family transcriptional regulator [Dietzia lutea]|uniref:Transcriptional regulator n=1 Tax=Dietzia lutea TaxID=546160 RepID=A0A2S1R8D0_9ACTN|nr:TetR/AcrR family transcriptional regulator [Dietzia lutea]AWH92491.1 hypothetical protein A6035_10315 [Dietzia lutea]
MSPRVAEAGVRRAGPGRPRAEGHDERIIEATLRLIDRGEPVTVNAVVAGSGVSRAALYRRWPSLTGLIADALDHGRVVPEFDPTADLRTTMTSMLFDRQVEARGVDYPLGRFRKRLELVMADPDLQRAYWESHARRRRESTLAALEAGVERGELRPDLDLDACLDALLGVFYYQAVVRGSGMDDPDARHRCRQAFETVWRGMAA